MADPTGTNVANASELLIRAYQKGVVRLFANASSAFRKIVRNGSPAHKIDLHNSEIQFTSRFAMPGGTGAENTTTDALPAANTRSTTLGLRVKMCKLWSTMLVHWDVFQMKSWEAVADEVIGQFESVKMGAQSLLSSLIMGDGTGCLATVATPAGGGAVITDNGDDTYGLSFDKTSSLESGMFGDLYNGAELVASAVRVLGKTANYGAGVVTLETTTDISAAAAGWKFYYQNGYANDPQIAGLPALLNSTGDYPIGGTRTVDRDDATYSNYRSMVLDATASTKTMGAIVRFLLNAQVRNSNRVVEWDPKTNKMIGKVTSVIFADPDALGVAVEELAAASLITERFDQDLGYEVPFASGIPMVGDEELNAMALSVDLKTMHYAWMNAAWVPGAVGGRFNPSRTDGYLDAKCRWGLQLYCDNPRASVRANNLPVDRYSL